MKRKPQLRTQSSSDRESSSARSSNSAIHGLIPVVEALRAGKRQIEQITIAEGARHERLKELLELAKRASVPVHRVPRDYFARVVGDARHQGVIARVAAAKYESAEDLLEVLAARVSSPDKPLALALDGIEDPRNLGAILRTAECVGVDAVFIPERRAVGLNETVAKTAAGALEYVPVARVTNLVRLIEQLKERNIWVVGAASEGRTLYTDWDWTLPTTLVLGNEGSGLHRLVRENCDALLQIPVVGKVGSLNVSVAAGVLLYEARRRRDAQSADLAVSTE